MIGSTILHYKILEKPGEGGMGEVYKAEYTKLDRFVVLKFVDDITKDNKHFFFLILVKSTEMPPLTIVNNWYKKSKQRD